MKDLSHLKKLVRNTLLIALLLVVFGYSYRATGIDFPRLVTSVGFPAPGFVPAGCRGGYP